MRAVNASGLLQAWEDASEQTAPERALRLVAAGLETTAPLAELARWSVRRRDAALFDLRTRVFGRFAEGLVPCPACDEPLELRLDLTRLRPAPTADDEAPRSTRAGELAFTYRLPNTDDLILASAETDEARARERLLQCCLVSVTLGSAELAPSSLEAGVAERIAARLAEEHADLDTTLTLDCPGCGRTAEVPFAIDTFLWREVDAWAKRTLQEVHALAREYGWSEHEILGLSARRRRLYIELAGRT